MSKQILFGEKAQEKLLAGVEKLYEAVSVTLGPLGSNVAIDKYGSPTVWDDGVSVAREIDLEDLFENIGAQLVKEASSKTSDVAGDGTTTSTILAYHIVKEGLNKGNPKKLRAQILEETEKLSKALKEHSVPVRDVSQIATISAQDPYIGKLIGEAFEKVGKDGVVTVEAGQGITTELIYKEGMEFDKGWESQYFVTNPDKMDAEVLDPFILVTDKKVSNMKEIFPFLENFVKEHKDLVIIADEISGEALAALALNKMKGTINVLAISAPGFGDRRREMLRDIAALTGATLISDETGRKLDSITIEDCGHAEKVWSNKETTRIIGGRGDPLERINQIKLALKKSTSDFEKEILQERLAKLSSGIAVITVGARTEVELKEKKEHVIDAVAATKAALEEGVIPGGATMLIHLCKEGFLKDIVNKPFEVLMKNSELPYAVEDLKDDIGWGFDVTDGEFKDLVEAGIIDPTKVVREALQNAVSVATSILTNKVLIVDKKEDRNANTTAL